MNLTKEAATNPDYEVEPKIFEEWEKKNGKVPEGAIVLLSFNWTAKGNSKTEYLGSKDPANNQTYHFPGLSPAGAQWLVTRNVYGVGTDTASIDPGKSKVRQIRLFKYYQSYQRAHQESWINQMELDIRGSNGLKEYVELRTVYWWGQVPSWVAMDMWGRE